MVFGPYSLFVATLIGDALPEQHDKEQEISKDANDDEDAVEDNDSNEEPGVTAEQLTKMGLGQVNCLVAVKICQQLKYQ